MGATFLSLSERKQRNPIFKILYHAPMKMKFAELIRLEFTHQLRQDFDQILSN